MEKRILHYAHPTGFAAGLTAGAVYLLCAGFVSAFPTFAVSFFNDWFHSIDLSKIFVFPQITFGSLARGLVEIVLFFYVTGVIYGWVYNKCVNHCKRKGWI